MMWQRIPKASEPLILALVPLLMLWSAWAGSAISGGLALLAAAVAILFMLARIEAGKPALRQMMPVACLSALAAAGRILFAAVPDVKPVSAIAILSGALLGPESGFAVGAFAALLSNFFFGQGAWTPLQMYAWGLVGYLGGVLARHGLLHSKWQLAVSGVLSGLLYGAILNGWYVLGYVRPLVPETVIAAFLAGLPLDLVHGLSTAGFLLLVWIPWGRSLRRALARYD